MEFKKIYNEYENVIKTGIKTVGYSAGALLAGISKSILIFIYKVSSFITGRIESNLCQARMWKTNPKLSKSPSKN